MSRNLRYIGYLLVILATVGWTTLIPACAAADVDSQNGTWSLVKQMAAKQYTSDADKDGKPFIDRMVKAADDLNDYSFLYEMNVFKKSRVISQRGNLNYKKPRKMRIEVTDGANDGSVAVMTQPGKVKGHLGGVLSIFSGTVSDRSSYLLSINGWPMVDSDFLSLAQALKKYVYNDGKISKVTSDPVEWQDGKKYFVVELYETSPKRLWKRIAVDPGNLLPCYWVDYQEGQLWTYSLWKNVRLNPGIADSVFKL
ncbi:MAG: hypothetical protein K2Y22_10875 [Candidatus Obscuribacterales bacterium]|nr:hypothetical protein [Candidatus Obscuribacterales bacterium]